MTVLYQEPGKPIWLVHYYPGQFARDRPGVAGMDSRQFRRSKETIEPTMRIKVGFLGLIRELMERIEGQKLLERQVEIWIPHLDFHEYTDKPDAGTDALALARKRVRDELKAINPDWFLLPDVFNAEPDEERQFVVDCLRGDLEYS